MIRVLVADDHQIVRGGIVALLAAAADIEVIGEAADGEHAVELALSLEPDIVLIDLRMPRLDGDEATARILAAKPSIRVVVLTTYETDANILTATRPGRVDTCSRRRRRKRSSPESARLPAGRSRCRHPSPPCS